MLQILMLLRVYWGSYHARERQIFETALLEFWKVSLRHFPRVTDEDQARRCLQQPAKRQRLKPVTFRRNISDIGSTGICTVFC